jgi:hypothetical protein
MITLNGCQKCENRVHPLFKKCKYYNQILSYLNQIDSVLLNISPRENPMPLSSNQFSWINKIEFECKYFKEIEKDKKNNNDNNGNGNNRQ